MLTDLESDIPIELARAAHRGTSFVPDDRAVQERAGYASTLMSDYQLLAEYADTDDKRATLAAEFSRYRDGYRSRYLAMLGAKSRCMSTMVAGRSNFPVDRQRKRSDHADRKTTELLEYRARALSAIRKEIQPELKPIMAGDRDAISRLADKIAKAEALQARMRSANAAIRKHARAGADAQITALAALGFTRPQATDLLKPDFAKRIGFADFELTNNNANIRRMKARLQQITRDHATESTEIVGARARIEDVPADNRIRIFYPGKPSADVRESLKRAGFRWTPSLGCWQAYRNHNSIAIANREAGTTDHE